MLAAGLRVFGTQFRPAPAGDEIANPIEFAGRSIGMVMAAEDRANPVALEEGVEGLLPERVVFWRDSLGLPNRKMKKDKDASGAGGLEIRFEPFELSRSEVTPALLLGIIQ